MYKYHYSYMDTLRNLKRSKRRRFLFKLFIAVCLLLASKFVLAGELEDCINEHLAPSLGENRPVIRCIYIPELRYSVCMCNDIIYIKITGGEAWASNIPNPFFKEAVDYLKSLN